MSVPHFVRSAEVRAEPVHWLWPGYIPAGKLTLLDGDPGLGKSLISIDLAARLSTGRPLPDGSGGPDRRRRRRGGEGEPALASGVASTARW
jgi:hypothetical protein